MIWLTTVYAAVAAIFRGKKNEQECCYHSSPLQVRTSSLIRAYKPTAYSQGSQERKKNTSGRRNLLQKCYRLSHLNFSSTLLV